jgi:hypothetical protein
MKEELYTRLYPKTKLKSKPIRPSKVGLVQIKWKSILRNKTFRKNIPISFVVLGYPNLSIKSF